MKRKEDHGNDAPPKRKARAVVSWNSELQTASADAVKGSVMEKSVRRKGGEARLHVLEALYLLRRGDVAVREVPAGAVVTAERFEGLAAKAYPGLPFVYPVLASFRDEGATVDVFAPQHENACCCLAVTPPGSAGLIVHVFPSTSPVPLSAIHAVSRAQAAPAAVAAGGGRKTAVRHAPAEPTADRGRAIVVVVTPDGQLMSYNVCSAVAPRSVPWSSEKGLPS
ncbi:hypothetical protein DIPPA_10153 [Diplonema papillatum]|nr:hypothetical protein DIPPA_10153 [Diplonema papillatum]